MNTAQLKQLAASTTTSYIDTQGLPVHTLVASVPAQMLHRCSLDLYTGVWLLSMMHAKGNL